MKLWTKIIIIAIAIFVAAGAVLAGLHFIDYQYIDGEGEDYILFSEKLYKKHRDYILDSPYVAASIAASKPVIFSSVEEMIWNIRLGWFSEDEIQRLINIPVHKERKRPIVDLESLMVPVCFDEILLGDERYVFESVNSWYYSGGHIKYKYSNANENGVLYLEMISQASYDNGVERTQTKESRAVEHNGIAYHIILEADWQGRTAYYWEQNGRYYSAGILLSDVNDADSPQLLGQLVFKEYSHYTDWLVGGAAVILAAAAIAIPLVLKKKRKTAVQSPENDENPD